MVPHDRNIFPFYEELDWSGYSLGKPGTAYGNEPAAGALTASPMLYPSRARVLFARRNLRASGNTCLVPTSASSPPKKRPYICYIGQGTLAKATLYGTYRGMFVQVPIEVYPH